ncbi:MAG: FAD-dependent oxidoreductase [Myxococcota bacterium]
MNADVVVVGAGLGGLSAAMILASRGWSVVVVDAATVPGGKAGVVELDGVRVDTGPSLLTLVDVVDGAFQAADASLRDEVELCVPEGGFEVRFPDAGFVLGHGLEGALAGIEAGLGRSAGDQAARFLLRSREIWEEVAPAFVLGEAPRALSLARLGPRNWMRLLRADPFRTMWTAICAEVDDPHLRALFARFATYNGSDPRQAPATLNCIAWVELGLGAFGVRGGVFELVEALVRVGARHGVQHVSGAAVQAIEHGREGVSGVRLADGRQITARAVVCNAEVRHLAEDLLPGAVEVPGDPSTSGWTGVLRVPRGARSGHGVLFNARYQQEFEDLFDARRCPVDPTVYVCAPEKAHAIAGWSDEEPLFVMINAPADRAGPADAAAVAPSRRRALERLVQAGWVPAGVPVVWERTPRELASRFPGSGGALYGAASNSRFAAFQRPDVVTRVPGLFLASGSAHPGGGIPLVVQSGRLAAGHVHEFLGRGRP